MKILRLLLASTLLSASAHAARFDLNDVAILLPMPAELQSPAYLDGATAGTYGELLPAAMFAQIPALTESLPTNRIYRAMRVVGIRLDPARSQVRLVWQPLVQSDSQNRAPKVYAIDAAAHSFYALPASEFKALAAELLALKQSAGVPTDGLSIRPHPAIRAQGYAGAYAQGLRARLLARIGVRRMTKLTFMTIRSQMTTWDFGGFDIVGGELRRLTIARTGERMQTIVNHGARDFLGKLAPEPKGDDTITELIVNPVAVSGSPGRVV